MNPVTLGGLAGLAFLSGLRLYSTVLALGLGIRFQVITLPPSMHDLRLLAEPQVLLTAGLMYTLEFFADKIPWVDSAWDAVHTFIRPLGAALIGAAAVGDVDPVTRVAVALVCGGIGLSSHSAKAGTRLVVNHSPEPFSNIGVSLAEDGVVVGGVWLALQHPLVSLTMVVAAVAFIVWMIPKLYRVFRRQAQRIWELLNSSSAA